MQGVTRHKLREQKRHGAHLTGSAEMVEEPTHFIMIADEGEPHLVTGAPKENPLRESGTDLPQPRSQLGQPKAGRELSSGQGADEQINAAFEFQLLDGIEALEAAPEGRVKTVPHSQAPEIAKRGVGCAERSSTRPTLGQSGQERQLFVRQGWLRHDSGFGQQNALSFNDESDDTTPLAQVQRLSDRFRQTELTMGVDISGDERLSHAASFQDQFISRITASTRPVKMATMGIDEVRIYNRALSAQEVADLYNLGR